MKFLCHNVFLRNALCRIDFITLKFDALKLPERSRFSIVSGRNPTARNMKTSFKERGIPTWLLEIGEKSNHQLANERQFLG